MLPFMSYNETSYKEFRYFLITLLALYKFILFIFSFLQDIRIFVLFWAFIDHDTPYTFLMNF